MTIDERLEAIATCSLGTPQTCLACERWALAQALLRARQALRTAGVNVRGNTHQTVREALDDRELEEAL